MGDTDMIDILTIEHIVETARSLMNTSRSTLYYVLNDVVQRGQCYVVAASDWNPRYVILHPDDLDTFTNGLPCYNMVPLRDEPIEDVRQRILSRPFMQPKAPRLEDYNNGSS
jgi:hypothetical protein